MIWLGALALAVWLMNNILLLADFMTYKLAQDALDAVFAVVVAAIKNLTGIPLKF